MATAIARSADTGEPVAEILNRIAREYGREIGTSATVGSAPPKDAAAALERAVRVLRRYGYEPRCSDSEVELANCPFHALAQEQTELACNMNHALITGVADALAPHGPDARLCPGRDRCCVVLTPGGQ
jgi:predicted ArsR family transcriptional regulator